MIAVRSANRNSPWELDDGIWNGFQLLPSDINFYIESSSRPPVFQPFSQAEYFFTLFFEKRYSQFMREILFSRNLFQVFVVERIFSRAGDEKRDK